MLYSGTGEMLSTLLATLWLTGAVFASTPPAVPGRPPYKVLTGFPQQLDQPYIPDTLLTSRGCVVDDKNGDKKNSVTNGVWEGEVPVDSWPFTITICTKLPDMIKVSFTLEQSPITQCYDETVDVNINSGMPYPCRNFVFCNGTKLGTLTVKASCDPNACPENNFKIYMEASFPTSSVKLFSSVVTTNPIIGKPVTIEAKLQDTSGANINPLNIISAVMEILMPGGNIITKVMDVLKDGSLIGKFIPFLQSENTDISSVIDTALDVLVKVTGASEDDVRMYRTVAHLLVPTLQQLFTSGKISVGNTYTHPATNSQMVKFTIPVRLLKAYQANNYRYYTEVWGTDVNGTEKAVCWISGLTDIQLDNSTEDDKYYNGHFDIEMDTNWMVITETLFPLHFRNFSIEETSGFVELVQNDRMEIDHDPWLLMWATDKQPEEVKITREMMEGYNPVLYDSEQADDSKLLLVHGYCSSGDAFPTDEFTDYAVFKDYEQSRDLDEFAQLIDQYARSQDINAYSIVAHSQGGMAALHLLTYYHSGLDLTTSGGRKIQTVGTPWQGTPAMGVTVDIADKLGFGCGDNPAFGVGVASRWLIKIPQTTQSQVYYYTTEAGSMSGPCEIVTEMLLEDPNDGIAEKKRSQLPGGTAIDHTVGECHLAGMTYPDQCYNNKRNSDMNKHAAR